VQRRYALDAFTRSAESLEGGGEYDGLSANRFYAAILSRMDRFCRVHISYYSGTSWSYLGVVASNLGLGLVHENNISRASREF
jgi:hypothetical protein